MSTFYMSMFTLVFDYPHSKVARGSPVIFKKIAFGNYFDLFCDSWSII